MLLAEPAWTETVRQRVVRDLLLRSCGDGGNREEGERFLHELGLPWLDEALRWARDLFATCTTPAPPREARAEHPADFGAIQNYLRKQYLN